MPNLVEIVPVVLEKIFLISSIVFSLFRNYLLLEKGGGLHLYKLEIPSPKDTLIAPSFFEIGLVVIS